MVFYGMKSSGFKIIKYFYKKQIFIKESYIL